MSKTLSNVQKKALKRPGREYLADSRGLVYGWLEAEVEVVYEPSELEPETGRSPAATATEAASAEKPRKAKRSKKAKPADQENAPAKAPTAAEPAVPAESADGDVEASEGLLDVVFQQLDRFPELPSKETMAHWMAAACERPTEVAVRFVDEEEGRELNETFRKRKTATNVITWDYTHEPVVTADIAICVPVLVREAKAQDKTFEEHLAHLLVHGILHAHGYDHLNEAEAEIMEARETEVITGLGFEPPYSDAEGRVHD